MSFLRDEFNRGRAPLYLLAAAPAAVALGLVAWAPLFPFISALAVYPVFFHYLRSGRLRAAFLATAAWAAMHFALVAAACAMDAGSIRQSAAGGFVAEEAVFGERETAVMSDLERAGSAAAARTGDWAAVMGLSAVSGGALALAAGAAGLNHLALKAGLALGHGHGLDAAILSFPPWMAFRAAGLLMTMLGASYLFILRLEGRPMEPGRIAGWIALGAFFLAFDAYLMVSLEEPWARFLAETMK